MGDKGIQQYAVGARGTLSALSPADVPTGASPAGLVLTGRGYAYAACRDGLFQYKRGAAGALLPLSPASVPAEKSPQAITADPDGHRIYVFSAVGNTGGTAAQYAVGSEGQLTRTADALLPTGAAVSGTTLAPSGHFLYLAHTGGTAATGLSLEPDGSLKSLPPLPFSPPGFFAAVRHSVHFVPAMREVQIAVPSVSALASPEFQNALAQHPEFVYVVNTPSDTISQFRVQADGTLSALGTTRTGSQPMSIALDARGRFAYVACAGNQHVWQYRISADGTLAALTPPTVFCGERPFSITITPDSKFVYVLNRDGNTVSPFRVGANGTLSPLAEATKTDAAPEVISMEPTGRFLYVRADGSNSLARFAIGPDGTLTRARPSLNIGGGIAGVPTFSSTGFAYVSGTNQEIYQYRDGADGTLLPLSPDQIRTDKQLAFPSALATEPTGKFLYASNEFDNSLSSYRIGADGRLSLLAPDPIPTGASPGSLVADPSGHFLYVLNTSNRAIAQYRISPSGALSRLTPAQARAGKLPGMADPNAIGIIRR